MKRILSIDGGGIKGVFPAAFLAHLEEELDKPIGEYFDLIVGTSTGGIIALGLGFGLSAKQILNFYEEKGPVIFGGNKLLRLIRHLSFSKYNHKPLKHALESVFGAKTLEEASRRLVIPSLNLETGEVHIFKTPHSSRFWKDGKRTAVEVALCTASAPTYFPTYRLASGTPLIDGGMWANNPVAVAVVEALGILNWPAKDFRVLSLGCTTEPLNLSFAERFGLGRLYWAKCVVDVFMAGQSSSAMGMADHLVGSGHIFRISPAVANGRFCLDDVGKIKSLSGLGYSEARKALPTLVPMFFSEATAPFVPANHKLENERVDEEGLLS